MSADDRMLEAVIGEGEDEDGEDDLDDHKDQRVSVRDVNVGGPRSRDITVLAQQ